MFHFEDDNIDKSEQEDSIEQKDLAEGLDVETYLTEDYFNNIFVNKEPLSSEALTELYVSKTKQRPRDEVIIDKGVLEKQYSPYELMFSYLMRLNMRFTPAECTYLENETNLPVTLFNKDGGSERSRWLSISQVQKLIKSWRKTRSENSPIVEDDELLRLEDLANQTASGTVNMIDKDYCALVYFSQDNIGELPIISGCLVSSDGSMKAQPITIDTAATSSILPYSIFSGLGYSEKDLDTRERVIVSTACSKGNSALGTFATKVYLKSLNQKFYSVMLKFLVMKSSMNRVLLGISDLRGNQAVWDSSKKIEKVTMSVRNVVNKTQRKSFQCFFSGMPGDITLEAPVSVTSRPSLIKYSSSHFIDPQENIFSCENRFHLKSVMLCESKMSFIKVRNGKRWPKDVKYIYNVEMTSDKVRPACARLQYNVEPGENRDVMDDIETLEQVFHDFQHSEVFVSEAKPYGESQDLADMDTIPSVPDLQSHILDVAGVGPPDPLVTDDQFWYLPDMSSLSPYWREKYTNLFSFYRNNFARSKYDFVQSKLPEVDIKLKKDFVPAYDRPRRYGNLELLLIDDYIENLVKAGHIRELTECTSPFNHCLVLVYRQEPGNKVFISSKADRADMTNSERLELLKKNSRLCADMRSLNRQCESPGGMYLSRFQEILPAFSQRVISTLDVKSGYNIVKISYESSLYTAFVHRNKQFVWLTLPQGLVSAPHYFVRRLSLCLNDDSYNSFSAELNRQLENKTNNKLLIYDCDERGNQESELLSSKKKKHKECTYMDLSLKYDQDLKSNYIHKSVLTVGFSSEIFPYMDDVCELTDNNLEHYYIWCYLMYQFDFYQIKIAAAKVQLISRNITFLGYNLDMKENKYGLTAERKRDFANWKFPTSRSTLLSRMCIVNYFSSVILSFKVLTQCLSCLVNCKKNVFHVQEIHVREFEMLKLAIDLCSSFTIPDMRYPALYSCDASFSSVAGNFMQYIPDETAKHGHSLQLVAQFSKKFGADNTAKSPLYKEIISVLATLKEFEHFIRNNCSVNLLFSDASSLSMVSKLQFCNSKLHSFSVYLQSFPSLFLYFTPSSRLNFQSDYISKIYCGQKLKMTEAIPQKYLESIDNIRLKKGELISPKVLHAVLQAPLPKYYSDIPDRRKQAFDPLFENADFEKIINTVPVEQQYLEGLLFGYSSIPADSVAYQRRDKQGIVSRDEYNKMYQKSSGDKIREHFKGLIEHSVCVMEFRDISEECKQWVRLLDSYLRENSHLQEPSLKSSCRNYLQNSRPSIELFRNLINIYQESSLYNTLSETDEIFPTLFVLIFLHNKGKITLQSDSNHLIINSKNGFIIDPWSAYNLSVGLTFLSRYNISINSLYSDRIIFHPQIHTFHSETFVEDIFIFNNSSSSLKISPNQEMFRVKIHRQVKGSCQCENKQFIKFILEKESDYLKRTSKYEILFSSCQPSSSTLINDASWKYSQQQRTQRFLANTVVGMQGNVNLLSSEVAQSINLMIKEEDIFPYVRPGHRRPVNLSDTECSPGHLQIYLSEAENVEPSPGVSVTPEDHNSIILAGLILQKNECFTPALIKNLQKSCEYLSSIREKIKDDKEVKGFTLTKGILYKKNKWNIDVLCLDRVTLSHIVSSVHGSHRHYGNLMMKVYLESYFFCKDMKKIIEDQKFKCSVCFFNRACQKIKFVNNPQETEPAQVYARVYTDCDEFFARAPLSKNAYLCLYVDGVSGYTVAYPLKALTADALCNSFEDLVKNFGVMKELTSDFAAGYRSNQFRELLRYYNVIHRKFSPGRSAENGTAEVAVKEYRRTYMNTLISLVGSDTLNWDLYLPMASLIFNSQAIHASDNTISRFNLFFNSNRYSAPWLYSKVGESSLNVEIRKQLAFKNLFEKRQRFREHYRNKDNPFSVGQFCVKPLSKADFPTRNDSKGLQQTVQNLFKVMEVLPNSCKVKSLLDSSESVQDLSGLRAMDPCELRHLFGKSLDHAGSFSESIFKRGSKDSQMFEKLKNLEAFRPRCPGITNNGDEHICPGVFVEDDTQPGVEGGHYGDSGVEPDPVEAEVEADQEQEQANKEGADLVAPELEGAVSLVNPLHPYHLRPRRRAQPHGPGEAEAQTPDQGVTGAGHEQPDLTQAVEGARRLRPRKVIKYTYVTSSKQLRFRSNVSVREYEKKSPVRTCLGQVEQYPCTLDGFNIDIEHYIPSKLQFDPTLSRREVMLILCKNINTQMDSH